MGEIIKKILQVVTYPLDKPRHGGQIRCSEIRKTLETQGYEVTTLCVLPSGTSTKKDLQITVPNQGANDLPYLGSLELAPLVQDLVVHDWLNSSSGQKAISEISGLHDYQAIVFEQPWTFSAFSSYFGELPHRPKYIYSSHNHELPLKTQIIREFAPDLDEEVVETITSKIRDLENQIVSSVDEIWTVTVSDIQNVESPARSKVILAPNGARKPKLKQIKPFQDCGNFALFVGSAYPPNFFGFINLIGKNTFFLPPDFRIICVGGVATMIRSWASGLANSNWILEKLVLVDDAPDDVLASLLTSCNYILLPIQTGSGSNLKTAEALASGKPIVATEKAMRGFEAWLCDEGVFIANDQSEFRKTMGRLAVQQGASNPIHRISNVTKPLFWEDCLANISSGTLTQKGQSN